MQMVGGGFSRARATWGAVVAASLVLGGALSASAAQDGGGSSCVACHTDAARLKALTPPDPPPAETGEG